MPDVLFIEDAQGKKFVYQNLSGVESLWWFADTKDIIAGIEGVPKESGRRHILKGQIAYKGKVTGRARILISVDDIPKFKDGEILITINSNPTFMPAIRKAAAIVSDEGGITCHASIVSRELKIPCVVGTKIATQVLKDGDLVEVDAEKGVVRKLK